MGGPKGNLRGNKTHRADQLINGTSTEADKAISEPQNEEATSGKQHKLAENHPTGRKTATAKPQQQSDGLKS